MNILIIKGYPSNDSIVYLNIIMRFPLQEYIAQKRSRKRKEKGMKR